MTACSCPPDDCHGGHTIDVGPSWVCVTDDRLRQFRDDPTVAHTTAERSMAAELLALRARVTTMEAHAADLINAESERARLSLYARNARRAIDTLWTSRRGHQSRASMQARMYRRARHSEADTRRDHDALAARVAELEAANTRVQEFYERARHERDESRARVVELEAEHGLADRVTAALDRIDADRALEAAQRAPVGYAVVTNYLDARWVQAAPVVSLEAAQARARVYGEHEARVVELREVTEP